MGITTLLTSGLISAGPELIKAAGSLIGGDAKDVADKAADAVDRARGSPDVAQQKLADLSPEQITALQSVKTKIAEIEADKAKAERNAQTEEVTQVNKTMRAEVKAEGIFKTGWRPFIGWVTGASFGGLISTLAYAIIQDPSSASDVIESSTLVLSMMLGILGVNVKKRSDDKEFKATGIKPKGVIRKLMDGIK